MLLKLLIWLGLKKERQFLRTLAKIEFGVSVFLAKLVEQAGAEGNYSLAEVLALHAVQENNHGKMLAALADGKNHIVRSHNGIIHIEILSNGEILKSSGLDNFTGKIIKRDSSYFPGEKVITVFENFELSKKYLSLKILFGNRAAFSYDWGDRLAIMHLLEIETQKFYQTLIIATTNEPLRAIAYRIVQDECEHGEYLYSLLHAYPEANLNNWKKRLFWAKLGLIVDAWRFWFDNRFST